MQLHVLERHCAFPTPTVTRPEASVHARMLATAKEIGGFIDLIPGRTGMLPPNCFWLTSASLVVFGTAHQRPALLVEASQAAMNVGMDAIIVRDEDNAYSPHRTSFDVWLEAERKWRRCLWLYRHEDGQLLLLPDHKDASGFRVAVSGLARIDRGPAIAYPERIDGLQRANATLDAMAGGK